MNPAWAQSKRILQNVQPAMTYPGGDPEQWKRSARKKLAQLLGLHKMIPGEAALEMEYEHQHEPLTELRFTFQSEDGYRVPCHL